MKPQDLLFFLILLGLVIKGSAKGAAMAGLICLVLAIPLFAKWIFFTAERLTWYSVGFFLLAIVLSFFSFNKILRKTK